MGVFRGLRELTIKTAFLFMFFQSNIKSLKHCLYSAARFAGDLFICCPDATQLQTDLLWVLFPLILEGCTENLSDLISLTVERAVGRAESDEFLAKVYRHVLANTFGILLPNKQVHANPVNFVFVWVPVTGIWWCRFKNPCLIT